MRTILLSLLTLNVIAVSGQSSFRRNSLYIEAGGNGVHASVNFERQLFRKPGLGLRFGAGTYFQEKPNLTIPLGLNYLFRFRRDRSFIDAGLGVTMISKEAFYLLEPKDPGKKHFVYLVPGIGYRGHTENDMLWRVSFTPAINKNGLFPWVGIAVGKVF